jgi:serine protease Do
MDCGWLRLWIFSSVFICSGLNLFGADSRADISKNMRPAVDAAIGRVAPALVRIRVVSTSYSDGREVKSQAVGSGAIITKEGHVISNHHVAGRAVRIFCTLSDREEIEAELIGTDPLTDICIIQLKPSKPRVFPTVGFGDSGKLRVGDPVLALGSPMALSQSVTLGIISNLEMVMPRFFGPSGRLRQEGEDVGSLVRWIAHDAQIYGGNSGGPLVNLAGEIVGINEIRIGLSGAIPGNLARAVGEKLIKTGKVTRAFLGVEVQPLLKGSGDRGVLVSGVLADSPAAKAGLQAGDIVVAVNGGKVLVRHDEELPQFMAITSDLPLDRPSSLTVLRGEKEQTVRLTPVEREELRPKQQELKPWGITARNLSLLLARELKRSSRDGVQVTSVRPGGPAGAAKPHLEPQDVIVQINDTPIRSLGDLTDVTSKITEGKKEPTSVLAAFERNDRRYVTVVRVGSAELRDPGLEATKAWLALETQVISREIAAQLGQKDLKGFYVTCVYPGGAGEKAGLRPGDSIVAVDEEKLTADAPEHEEDLATLIRQYDPGTTVKLGIVRDKQRRLVPVELERAPRLRREMKKYRNDDFEFVARDIGFEDKAEEQWSSEQKGVYVEDVKSGSWAELGTLYSGDLIIEVDGEPVRTVEDLRTQMERIAKAKKHFIVMKVLRGIHTKFLEFEPKWPQ